MPQNGWYYFQITFQLSTSVSKIALSANMRDKIIQPKDALEYWTPLIVCKISAGMALVYLANTFKTKRIPYFAGRLLLSQGPSQGTG